MLFCVLQHLTESVNGMPLMNDESERALLPNETAAGIIETVNRGTYMHAYIRDVQDTVPILIEFYILLL